MKIYDNRYGNINDNRDDSRNRIVVVYRIVQLIMKYKFQIKSKFYKLVFIYFFFITAIRNLDFRYLVQLLNSFCFISVNTKTREHGSQSSRKLKMASVR